MLLLQSSKAPIITFSLNGPRPKGVVATTSTTDNKSFSLVDNRLGKSESVDRYPFWDALQEQSGIRNSGKLRYRHSPPALIRPTPNVALG